MTIALLFSDCRLIDEKKIFDGKLFSFCEWQRYIQFRRAHLVNEHFPTKLKYDSNGTENSHLYVNFMQGLAAKSESLEPVPLNKKRTMTPTLIIEMTKGMERLIANMPEDREVIIFPPSQTPQYSYFKQLIEIRKLSYQDNTGFFKNDPADTLPGYMTKPKE